MSVRTISVILILVGIYISGLNSIYAQTAKAPTVGDGSLAHPYEIDSLNTLYWITAPETVVPTPTQAERWVANYKQTANINASATSTWSGGGWVPIGNSTTKFSGKYDGQGFTIDGLFINRGSADGQGLFSYTSGSEIKNLGLTNININGYSGGGLVGGNSGSITNSYSSGSISGFISVGGLVGSNDGSITNSHSSCSVNSHNYVAGLVGYNAGSITNSYSSGTVNGSGEMGIGGLVGTNESPAAISNSHSSSTVNGNYQVGGLAGYNGSSITTSYSDGTVNGNCYVGGLVGSNGGTITTSYTSASVNSNSRVGGMVGQNDGSIINSYSTGIVCNPSFPGSVDYAGGLVGYNAGSITKSYTSGYVVQCNGFVGGLVGYNAGPIANSFSSAGFLFCSGTLGGLAGGNSNITFINNSFWDLGKCSIDNGIGTGKTSEEILSYSTYINAGWDFIGETANGSNDYWGIDQKDGASFSYYPFLNWQGYSHRLKPIITTQPVSDISASTATGNGNITLLGYPTNPTQFGVCWNTSENPTIYNNKTTQGAVSTTGAFTSSIAGLLTNTTYYVRAYATNENGTSYGEQVSFSYSGFAGSGTDGDRYLIQSLNDLKYLSDHSDLWDKSFKQTANINASATSTWSGGGWIPIGTSLTYFNGKYDGQGNTIDHLYINRDLTSYYQGLFGYSSMAVIQNLGLTNVTIIGGTEVGGLVGCASNSTVTNSYSSGSVSGNMNVGGLIGSTLSSPVTNSYSSGSVSGESRVGGLIGLNRVSSTITNSYCSNSVSGSMDVGGLVGYNHSSTVTSSFSSGSVSSTSMDVGGLIGYNSGSTVTNSFSSGSVSGTNYAGGLVGFNSSSTLTNSYSSGIVNGSSNAGGLAGRNSLSTVNNCFWNKTVNPGGDNGIGTGKTTEEMKSYSTCINAGWDFIGETTNGSSDYWGIDETGTGNNGYPFLNWQGYTHRLKPVITTQPVSDISVSTVTGNGNIIFLGYPTNPTEHGVCWSTHETPTTGDSKTTQGAVSSTGAFTSSMADLLTNTTYYVRAYATNAVGTSYGEQVSFSYSGLAGTGTDGDRYLIQSLNDLKYLSDHNEHWDKYIKQTADINFASASPAVTTWNSGTGWLPISLTGQYDGQGHIINGLYILRPDSDNQGLFDYANGCTIENIRLTNVNITGKYNIGGLVGSTSHATIRNSCSEGIVTGFSSTGGLVGDNSFESQINNSYSSGTVVGQGWVGGLVGSNNASIISNSYSSANVSESIAISGSFGGLIGYNDGSSTIQHCYSAGSVTSTSTHIGGLIGENYISTITGCFWDAETDGIAATIDGSDNYGATGKSTSAMKTNSTFLSAAPSAAWDYTIWKIDAGRNNGYPYLSWQYSDGTPLPVVLTSFTASANNNKVELKWETATEVNNYGFEIERTPLSPPFNQRGETGGFKKVGFVAGAGNSNSPKQYSFVDNLSILQSCNLQYRLKQIDADGKYQYYPQIAEVKSSLTDVKEKQLPTEFGLSQNYPNPFNPMTVINYQLPVNGYVELKVFDLLGKEVAALVNEEKPAGSYSVNFNACTYESNNLPSGVYIYRLQAGSFTQARKFVLLK